MNVRTTVILLILLVLCTAYIVVFHTDLFGPEPVETEPEAKADKSLTPNVGKVRRLELQRPGAEKIVLVRRDEKWHLAEPIDAPAIGWQADSTLRTVTTLRYARKYAPDDPDFPNDELTSLSAPLRTVTFTNEQEVTHTIKVGLNVVLSEQTYVQLDGDKHVYVVNEDLLESLDKTVADYREKNIAKFDTEQARRFELRGEQQYRLVKVEGRWAIDRPVAARADQDKVKSLLGDLSGLSAEAFVNDSPNQQDLSGYGLDAPRLTVTVELAPPEPASQPATAATQASRPSRPAGGKIISIAFGKVADKKVFAKLHDRPWVFQVDESKLKDLQPELADIRDKHVLDVGEKEITRVELALSAGEPTILEKVEGHWRMRSPHAGPCDAEAVEQLTRALSELQATEFVDAPATPAAFGLAEPVGRIALHFRGSDKTTTILLGRKSESGQTAFVRDAAGKSVAVIQVADYRKLVRTAPSYWTKKLFELPEKAMVTRVDLDRPDGKFTVAQPEEGEFQLVRPAGPADEDNVKALLDALKAIKAERVVWLGEAPPEHLAKLKPIRVAIQYRTPVPETQPAATTTAATRPTTEPATAPATGPATRPAQYKSHQARPIHVVKDKAKTYLWQQDAAPLVVGELGEEFYDKLAAEMRDRTVLRIDPEKAVSLKVELAEQTMEFTRSGKEWRYTADLYLKVDASKIEEFLSQLAAAKPKRFVDYSPEPELQRFGLDKPAMTITAKTDSGEEARLIISRTGPVGTKGHYAASNQAPGVFVLAPETPKKMEKALGDFRKQKE